MNSRETLEMAERKVEITPEKSMTEHSRDEKGASARRWGPGARLGVIGGLGEMGGMFAQFFRNQGYVVEVADRATEVTNEEVIQTSDVVVFAVPLHETEAIIRELAPLARPDQLLMDLTSLKTGPVREMLCSRASVVGLHPMFGGRTSSFVGQTMVACPARIDGEDWTRLRGLFTGAGMRVKESAPEEHDRMMSIIQVLFHMTTMLTGRILRDLDVNIEETLEYTSPSYRIEMSLLGRIFAQNGLLYSAITQMNPYTKELIEKFRSGLNLYEEWCDAKDLNAFVSDFERSAEHLGDFCRQAYRESSAILNLAVQSASQNKESARAD